MDEDGALFDARFDDGGPFRDTPEPGGISLDSALRDFGPAAFDDLIPRVRALARALDAAHSRGVVHGALNPSKIIITDAGTSIVKGGSASPQYLAPEVAAGKPPGAAADQFSLAAITYEWLFGKRIDGAAHRPISVPSMPDVDRAALAKAFTRALAPDPAVRFASCGGFCDALSAATVPALPLALAEDDPDVLDAVGPFVPESVAEEDLPVFAGQAPEPDANKIVADEPNHTAAASFAAEHGDALLNRDNEPDFDAMAPAAGSEFDAVPSWNPAASPASNGSPRFSGAALIIAAVVGAVFGFAGGYMARPRALQSGPAEVFATPPTPDAPAAATPPNAAAEKPSQSPAPAGSPAPSAPPASAAAPASAAPAESGRLLVRSSPSGATVSVDGVAKGVTPLALRDVEFGTRNLTIARSGYATETRRIVINSAQPSRSLDVALTARAAPSRPAPAAAAPTPGTPAALGKPAVTTGTLVVDSRPAGASVTVNGKPSGTTPLTIDDLAPGEYRITMTRPGYRNFTATVRVVAGERVRAAYSLTAQEQE